ncbi:hypothetical protein [Mesoterricola silvestris]|uniref:LPP20 lipoprotein n=1 Tax=Mesoterricola silvestris TaxID=2927979 RepID=A0AA48GRD9_9BACT|nr:hypothetical protein [Mesoterricola silvestris]BDU74744.1 hypothetical protein METEAL_39180 [Mesoterricola silvestris]
MLSALLLSAALGLQPAPRPAWVERLPESPGRLYAMGTADLVAREGQSITRASDRARLEVVARLRATVKGQTSITQRTAEGKRDGQTTVGSGERVVREEVSVGARAEDLPGLVVEQTFTDPAARTVYALAYLDLPQARATLASRLDAIRLARVRLGKESSRRALWKFRKLTLDLDQVEASLGLLAVTGVGADLRPLLEAERAAVDLRRDHLNQADLPPVDFSRTALGLRSNVDLPPGVASYLKSQVTACGLVSRETDPDLVLDLAFGGGPRGPEFIFTDMDVYSGVTYRLEAKVALTEGGGAPLTRTVPIVIVQGESPEGMVNQFRRQIERWLPRLLGEFKAEMR